WAVRSLSRVRPFRSCCRHAWGRATGANRRPALRNRRPTAREPSEARSRGISSGTSGVGGSGEVDVGLAVLGVLLAEPGEEFTVMLLAAVAAVGLGVVAQVQQPAPPVGGVGGGPVGRETAEERHVARPEFQGYGRGLIDRLRRQGVVLAVFG